MSPTTTLYQLQVIYIIEATGSSLFLFCILVRVYEMEVLPLAKNKAEHKIKVVDTSFAAWEDPISAE